MLRKRILTICVLLMFIRTLCAESYQEIKESIHARSAVISLLKAQGLFKEGSTGLLEAGGQLDALQQLTLRSENKDRSRIFEIIAQRTGKKKDDIGRAFAAKAAVSDPLSSASQRPAAAGDRPPSSPSSAGQSQPQPEPVAPAPQPPRQTPSDAQDPTSSDTTAASSVKLKVLTRPRSRIFTEPREASQPAAENVPSFTAYYVNERTSGWYKVSSDNRGIKTLGWMRAEDVVEWKQNLVVSFSTPDGRKPVLMFEKPDALETLLNANRSDRATRLNGFHSAIDSGRIPKDFPISVMEPKRALDSRDQFYLLPILDYKERELDDTPCRILKVAAVTRGRGATTLKDPATLASAIKAPDFTGDAARAIKTDIVFVVDTTRSMGPFLEQTLKLAESFAQKIGSNPKVASAVRFGIWGYRDFPESMPGIEYNTHNYTPALQSAEEFAVTLRNVRETKVDSVDYEEDVFAGVHDAIQQTRWRENSLKFIILVGDAPGRAPKYGVSASPNGPSGTKANMDVQQIRGLATENQVFISALYIKSPKWVKYLETGETQFKKLSQCREGARASYQRIDGRDATMYSRAAQSLAFGIIKRQLQVIEGRYDPKEDAEKFSPDEPASLDDAARAGDNLAANMFRQAILQTIAKKDAPTAPRDISAWVLDKDIADPSINSLEVKIFLTKEELNSLRVEIDTLLNAGTRARIASETFFDALQTVVTMAGKDASRIREHGTLKTSGVVPDFLKGLPYKSTLMDMNNDMWRNMSPDAQGDFLTKIESKLQFYRVIHDDVTKWQPLNPGDDRDNYVTHIPLNQLP